MQARHARLAERLLQGVDEPPPEALTLCLGKQVDVQVGGVLVAERLRSAVTRVGVADDAILARGAQGQRVALRLMRALGDCCTRLVF